MSFSSYVITMSSVLELRYFDGKGAVETSRLLMAISGMPYTDTRWPMDMSKPYGQRCPGFMAAKGSGELQANLDRAPILIVDGVPIGQSAAIERFLARHVGLHGANEVEAALVDCFVEHIRDLKELHSKAQDRSQFMQETLPTFLAKMEAVAGEAYVVGPKLTLADVALYQLIVDYFPSREAYLQTKDDGSRHEASPDASNAGSILDGMPRLAAAVEAVRSHPAVVRHVSNRKYSAPW